MIESNSDPKFFTQAVTALGEMRPVVTTQAIFNSNGIKIVEQGVAVNRGLYERLMQHQLSSPIEDSVASTATVTSRMLRDKAEELMLTVPLLTQLALQDETRGILLDTLERIPLPPPIAFQLTLACEVRPTLYQNALCSALIAAWLAMEPKLSRFNMGVAAAAGLLHDLGMLHLDPCLLEYKSDIDRSQRRQLYSHPLVSKVLIERHPEYPKEIVRAVLEHHEFLDGSGYPRNLAGDQISHAGRILTLTELILSMFAPGRKASELRLSVLLRMNRHRYDAALAKKVMLLLRPQQDTACVPDTLLTDPVSSLLAIDGVLTMWPADLVNLPDLSRQRRENLKVLADQTAQLHRTLASVGATPEQLTQLGKEPLDAPLQTELTLFTREAAWQLQTLAHQARRRWRAEPGTGFPTALQDWLDRVDAVLSQLSDSHRTNEDGDASA